ncbi:hypothetical protein [Carp edema virus]|nr:hypothetical protein [Carp edema virus]
MNVLKSFNKLHFDKLSSVNRIIEELTSKEYLDKDLLDNGLYINRVEYLIQKFKDIEILPTTFNSGFFVTQLWENCQDLESYMKELSSSFNNPELKLSYDDFLAKLIDLDDASLYANIEHIPKVAKFHLTELYRLQFLNITLFLDTNTKLDPSEDSFLTPNEKQEKIKYLKVLFTTRALYRFVSKWYLKLMELKSKRDKYLYSVKNIYFVMINFLTSSKMNNNTYYSLFLEAKRHINETDQIFNRQEKMIYNNFYLLRKNMEEVSFII